VVSQDIDRGQLAPAELRTRIRDERWPHSTTGGSCRGFVQANLMILAAEAAEEFEEFCRQNPAPLPLLERTEPGTPHDLRSAPGADIRTDLSRYCVYREGRLDARITSIVDLWQPDHVAFLLGCSYSADAALQAAGVSLRHLEQGQTPPVFVTDVPCRAAGRFRGPVVMSMRPIPEAQLETAIRVTGDYPLAHGAPLHIGDPAQIGVDLTRPDWSTPIEPREGEIPVFWGCGVTPQAVIEEVKPDLAITHAPGHMFVTDIQTETLRNRPSPSAADSTVEE
jgi:uncharacterized protein YcsI (UPF0317 family)